jgi:hypothetical protein
MKAEIGVSGSNQSARRKQGLKSELGHAAVGVLGIRLTELMHAIVLTKVNCLELWACDSWRLLQGGSWCTSGAPDRGSDIMSMHAVSSTREWLVASYCARLLVTSV